jgi:hypothetical protein
MKRRGKAPRSLADSEMIILDWILAIRSDLSSTIGLHRFFCDGKGFAAPRLFGAFVPPFRRAYAMKKLR